MVLTAEVQQRAIDNYKKDKNPSTDEIIAFHEGVLKGIELAKTYNNANNQFNGFLNNLKNS
tara:strand:- start:202 stop:384 length:183 start_codon:yes stop_codon:yes gene_type:complete